MLGRGDLRRGALSVLLVGLDDALHEPVAHDVLAAEPHELDALDVAEDVSDDDQPGLLLARQVDLGDVAGDDHLRAEPEPGEEHLHLLGRGVLRLVEDHEGVVQRAPAHERQRCDLDHAALEMLGDLLGVDHVVQRVEQRPQVGIDLRHQVAGQEAEALAGLDRRARQDDPVDLLAAQRRSRQRDGEERLAGAGRPDPERDGALADRVDVALLADRPRRDARRAVPPDHVVEHRGRRAVGIQHPDHGGQRRLVERVPRRRQRAELLDHARAGLERAGLAVEREQVAAQVDARVQALLQRAQHRVVVAREPRREVVRQLELASHAVASAARTCSETRLPSARPATSAITIAITLPRSLADSAPDWATARATISCNWASSSSAGR